MSRVKGPPVCRRRVCGALREAPLLLAVTLAVACQSELPRTSETAASRSTTPADVVLRGGPVYTMNAGRSWARALAIRDGALSYVGTERGVAPFIGEHTRVVELRGRMVLENHTAALLEPYLGKSDERGMPFVDPEMLKKIVARLDIGAFHVHFHAIGDAAIRQSLDAVEAARTSTGNPGNRHYIYHIELFDPADIPRFQQLEVVANFQPLWACEARC